VAGQHRKDTVVLTNAEAIVIEHPPAAPRAQAIIEAVRANPAQDVEDLVREFDLAVTARDARIKRLEADLARVSRERDELRNGVRRAVTIGMFGLASFLVAAGVVIALLGGKVAAFGPMAGISVIGAGIAVFSLASVFDWLQKNPWAIGIALTFVLIAVAFMVANVKLSKNEPEIDKG
jgi:hypothetical protein